MVQHATIDHTGLPGVGAASVDYVRVTRSTTQTISTSTDTPIAFDTEVEDTDGYHAGSASTLVVPSGKAGVFVVRGGVFWDANATGQRQVFISKNGTAIPGTYQVQAGNSGFGIAMSTGAVVRLADGDTVELEVWQNSGANRTIGNSPVAALDLVRIGT